MSAPVPARESRSAQDSRRRKRKNRTADRAPEPKAVVSGAGQPLDESTRRELEESLGHDFSRVRLHTDRDSGELAQDLGADAVAVGQDVLFAPAKFRPGTAEGTRLLAHELLHTVQNPHGLGALRAGRELGAVSLPQQAIEREAESTSDPAAVRSGQATPGWLRYATVDADRRRAEELDPATMIDRLANGIQRSLRGDPEDRSKRTRKRLARLPEDVLDVVLDRLESRLLSSEHERVLDLLDEVEADPALEPGAMATPAVEPDAHAEVLAEREEQQQESDQRRESEQQPPEATGPEKEQEVPGGADGGTPENAGPEAAAPEQDAAVGEQESAEPASEQDSEESAADSGESEEQGGEQDAEQQPEGEQAADEKGADEKAADEKDSEDKGEDEQAEQDEKEAGEEESAEQDSAAQNRPDAIDPLVAKPKDRQQDVDPSPEQAGKDTQLAGAVDSLDGARNQDVLGPEEEPDSEAHGGDSEVEVGGEEKSAWDVKFAPEDFLPEQDLDVSGVPTADKLEPGAAPPPMPSFPAPPPTKAEQVQAERDAEDAEDEAAEAEPVEAEPEEQAEPDPSITTEGTPGAADLATLAADKAAEKQPGAAAKPTDPKAGADPEAGPAEAQRLAQEAPGKTEGAKDEPGGAVKESAAKEERDGAGKGGKDSGGKDSAGGTEKGGEQPGKGGKPDQDAQGGGTESEKSEAGGEDSGGAAGAKSTDDAESPSTARDSHTTGGTEPTNESSTGTDQPQQEQPAPAKQSSTPAPAATGEAPKPTSEPTTRAAKPTSAPAQKTEQAAPKPEQAKPAPAAPKAGPAPTAPRSGGGGKAGKGGGAKAKKQAQAAPNLSQVSPEAGLRTASGLKPHVALQAMGGVDGAVDRTVGDEHQQLAADPPSMQRPSGAPQTASGAPDTDAPAEYSQDEAAKSDAPESKDAEVKGEKKPEGPIPAEEVEEPDGWDTFLMGAGYVIGWLGEKVGFDVSPEDLAAQFAGMPTEDEAMEQAKAGTAPGVEMQGDAGDKSREQDDAVTTKGEQTADTARDDASRGMGEDQVYPDAPKEQLKGEVPGREGGKGGGKVDAGTGAVPPEAASEVAEHERGKEFKSAFGKGEQGLSDGKQQKDRDTRTSRQKHDREVDAEVKRNTDQQTGKRESTFDDVSGEREKWRADQDAELDKLGTGKTEKREQARKDVEKEEQDTDKKVEERKKDDDEGIKNKRETAKTEAKTKRDDTSRESKNWVEKAFDEIKRFFIELRDKIVAILQAARDAIVDFIENFKRDVENLIKTIRDKIVGLVEDLIEALIELAVALVKAVIELARRIRQFIEDLVAAAIAFVTELAAKLKQLITDLLEAISKLLSDILNVLKKALADVVQAVKDAIKSVLDFASKLLAGFGEFMMVAVDFLADPGGWLSGAKSSAEDGAKNHFFREVKSAVKDWFNQKIEEIIGLPKAIFERLKKGGISLQEIVKETWDAVVPQLPFIIGEIVITKVIAKLIPGAGWVAAVIDALQTAIGALGEILRAFGAVLDWLKSVGKGGNGVLFAKAVAAGVVALLELAYQFLLDGIGKYVSKVGDRFKTLAASLGKKDKGGKEGGAAPPEDRGGNGSDKQQQPGAGDKAPGDKGPSDDGTDTPAPKPGRPGGGKPSGQGGKTGVRSDKKADQGKTGDKADAPKKPGDDSKKHPAKDDKPRKDDHKDAKKEDKPDGRHSDPHRRKDEDGQRRRDPDRRDDERRDGKRRDDDRESPAKKKQQDDERDRKRDDDEQDRKRKDDDAQRKQKDEADPNRKKDEDSDRPKKDDDVPGRRDDRRSQERERKKDRDEKRDRDRKNNRDKADSGSNKRKRKDDDDRRRPKDRDRDPSRDRRRERDRNENKQSKKNDRKKDEESKKSKDDQLDKIVARLRPKLYAKMKDGIQRPRFLDLLGALKAHYRLTGLGPVGGDPFIVVATLNPSRPVLRGEYTEPHSEPDAYSVPPGEPKGEDVVQDGWTGRAKKGQWYTGKIMQVRRKDGRQVQFDFYGHGPSGKGEFRVPVREVKERWERVDFDKRWYALGPDFEAIRQRDLWSEYNQARQVLNYRMTARFTNPDTPASTSKSGNPVKPQWHHIVEQRQNGPNHTKNLVLTSATANQDFNTWMDHSQPAANPSTTSKHGLPSTNGKPVYQYLRGAGYSEKMEWGVRCMEEVLGRNPLGMQSVSKGRGIFLKLP
ncbi:DUF4157 domain-containing protein [Saccharopolyspora sp. 6M]|uniref:eCIS core domain-containing protein n=1 Tax=Saccharopolyspora sp. 6M TaxID=2877237 RepID=UPI001CD5996B|nr:DUF4157 domain-containing protein [Saccharopolyspora sp. 6M]MCA1224743.1 DUF4157 domain-containing protein [Saccharopolyspora sp. 6M]